LPVLRMTLKLYTGVYSGTVSLPGGTSAFIEGRF
jgi:hypothetical protein